MGSNQDIVYRFTVGEEGYRRSSIWRLWYNKPEKEKATSDVYFSYRDLAGKHKLSIHQSGEINFSYDANFAKQLGIANRQRHLDKWRINYTEPLFKVIVPYTEAKEERSNIKGKIHYIPLPQTQNAIEVYLYITNQSLIGMMPSQYLSLFEGELANRNILSLIYRDNPITEDNRRLYMNAKEKFKHITNSRLCLFVNNAGQERGFIDIAL